MPVKTQQSSGFDLQVQKAEETEVWNAKRVEAAYKAIDDGYKLKSTPFYMGNTNLRKANLVYDYSKWELDEIAHCAQDICYFADTYCKVMTDDGVQKIKLRDYQRAMLRHYADNRFSICLAARQIGKCSLYNTIIQTNVKNFTNLLNNQKIGDIYNKGIKLKFLSRLKKFLYKIYQKL